MIGVLRKELWYVVLDQGPVSTKETDWIVRSKSEGCQLEAPRRNPCYHADPHVDFQAKLRMQRKEGSDQDDVQVQLQYGLENGTAFLRKAVSWMREVKKRKATARAPLSKVSNIIKLGA